MRIVVVGASRVIGLAVADALSAKGHEVLRTSRNAEVKVNIEDPAAVKSMCESMYEWVGKVDAVVSCAGDGAVKPLTKLTDAEIQFSLNSKLMGQVNLVRSGVEHVNDGGVFVRTAGVFGRKPLPGVPALAMVNGALESFSRAAALDLPHNLRINTISPPIVKETAEQMGMKGGLPAAENAKTYVDVVEGTQSGEVVFAGE